MNERLHYPAVISGGELILYTIQGNNCVATQFRGRIVSLHNSEGGMSLYTIQEGNCLSTQFRGRIVSLHNSGGEMSLYTIQGGDCLSTQFRDGIVSPYNIWVFSSVDLQRFPLRRQYQLSN